MTAYWQGDPADVSVNAITQMAGISKPSLYREFGSEDGLKLAVLDRYADQVLSDMFVIQNAGQGLRETLDALIDFASDDPRMITGCLFFPGDNLTVHAVTGSILKLLRDWPVARLVRIGAALLLLQAVIAPLLILSVPEMPADIVALEQPILTRGSFLDARPCRVDHHPVLHRVALDRARGDGQGVRGRLGTAQAGGDADLDDDLPADDA